MRKQEFIDAIYDAGWRPSCDAQYKGIGELWKKIFPTVAILEDELAELRPLFQEFTRSGYSSSGYRGGYRGYIKNGICILGGGSSGGL